MSFYNNPRETAGLPSEQGTPLPASVLKIQQRRGVIDASDSRQPLSSSNIQNRDSKVGTTSVVRDSGLKRRGGAEKQSESSSGPHAPDIVGSVLLGVVEPPVQSAPSTSWPQLETMRSSDSSSSKQISSGRERGIYGPGSTGRFSFRRKGASDLHAHDQSRTSARMSWFMIGFWLLWVAAFVSIVYVFVFKYYLTYVTLERDEIGSSLAVSAAAVAGNYFTPLYQAVDVFNSSMNSGLLVSPDSFAGMSSVAYPVMNTVPYIMEISVFFNTANNSMRVRPSSGGMRIAACENAYPPDTLGYQLTNTLQNAPVIFVFNNTNCNDTINYCRYNLMCEPDPTAETAAIAEWNSILPKSTGSIILAGPQLYVSPDQARMDDEMVPTVAVIANAMYPTRVVGDLTALGSLIQESFGSSTGLVFVITSTGDVLAVSQDNIIQPFTLVSNSTLGDVDSVSETEEEFTYTSLITTASIYSLDDSIHPWVSLLPPESALASSPSMWSSSSVSSGWRVDIVRVFGVAGTSAMVVVATDRVNYTDDVMYSLYIAILVLGGFPVVGVVLFCVYYVIKKLLKVQSHIRESSTNI